LNGITRAGAVSPLQSPEHPMGHANKRAQPQHHWRFGHSPRMPGHCTQRVGQHSVSGLVSRDSITYDANKPLDRTGCAGRSALIVGRHLPRLVVEVDENMVSTPQGESASTARYPQGYCAKIIAYFETRNARVDAAFVCPYLQTGMHLLDCGCGPGTITVGLAEIVAPGRVVGVDFERGQIEKARALAAERNLTTIDLAVADLFALPFPSHTFDAIFAHAVLQNVGDPMRALKEMHRVLKPGGIIGVRNVDQGSNIYSPTDPLLDQAHALYFKRWKDIGGDPFGARHPRALPRETIDVNALLLSPQGMERMRGAPRSAPDTPALSCARRAS